MAADKVTLHSYIVARDFGFAPNPYFGYCTLATCKPRIRAAAKVGDWVLGTGARTKYGMAGRIVYLMRVDEALTFNEYWEDDRFQVKKPLPNGSLKQLYGDNIYHQGTDGAWVQSFSHHSLPNGDPNLENLVSDTHVDRVLISEDFVYFGKDAPRISDRFRRLSDGRDICCDRQGHKRFDERVACDFVDWARQSFDWGVIGEPLEFSRHEAASD